MTAYSRDTAAPASTWQGRHGTAVRLAERGGRFGDAFVFVVPLLLAVQFAVGGRLFLSEVVLLLALPFLLDDARRRGVSRISHGVVALGGLWLFGLVFTDVYRVTPLEDYSRGWSKVAFLLLNLVALALLIDGRWRRVTLFAAGLAIGQVVQYFVAPGIFAAQDPWKFGYGTAVTLAGVILASRPAIFRWPLAAPALLIALGVINLTIGFRSLAGICVLTAVIVLLASRSARTKRPHHHRLRVLATVAASLVMGIVVVQAYNHASASGILGAEAQRKYESQQGRFGTVIGGRSEILASLRAIRDSPIVGHGSWAKDRKYVVLYQDVLREAGYAGRYIDPELRDLIPTHSHLFGAWVEGGILASVFWLWALCLAGSLLPKLHRLADGRVVLVAFVGLSTLWDVLFSPFGAERRLIIPFYLIVLLLARDALKSGERAADRSQAAPQ